MKRALFILALLLFGFARVNAQLGGFGDVPIEITSESTRVENGLAIAETDVIIRYADTAIYCDYAQYNPDTRDVYLSGNVRIYREGRLFTAERALYNLETKILNTADFRGENTPFRFAGDTLSTLGPNAYLVKEGVFTTSDSSKPDYYLRARTVRIYHKDRVIFSDVKLYVGRVPVFWYPYLYQSLNEESGFRYTPGYSGTWGGYFLTKTTFPLGQGASGLLRVDLYSKRGFGLGFESRWGAEKRADKSPFAQATETKSEREERETKSKENWGRFRAYYINDRDSGTNETDLSREAVDPSRYRLSLQDRTYLTSDIYSTINLNKLSDKRFLQDFEEGEFRENPNPDNLIGVTKWDENYTLSLFARKQLNEDFDGTERTPELALDIKRQPLFGTRVNYDSETTAGNYNRNFAKGSSFPDYDSVRVDTYHQLSLPGTYFGWLSVVPHVGARATYYSKSGISDEVLAQEDAATGTSATHDSVGNGGSKFRVAVTANVEASFKLSKTFEGVQSRAWGLDGLKHVVQPYVNASFVYTSVDPSDLLQFDRINRSTQLPPIDFPQFNTIDSLDNWSIIRLGVRNRLQTRRDDLTFSWLEADTYFDVNLDRPDFGSSDLLSDTGTFSNVFNRIRFYPLPWVNLEVDSQLPLLDDGFTEVNSKVNFMVTRNVNVNVGDRYIDGNKQFQNSNQLTFGAYVRFDDNWAFSFNEKYEFRDGVLEEQNYLLHRDLSSWVASLGLSVRDNGNSGDIGVVLAFTLKDLPSLGLPISFNPSGGGDGGNRNH